MRSVSGCVLLVILSLGSFVESMKILGVFPMPSKSHYILGNSLMRGLAEKGHDVTMISAFGDKNPPKGRTYTDVILTGMLDEAEKRRHEINLYEIGDMPALVNIPVLSVIMSQIGELVLNNSNVQKFLKSEQHFDAVIVEQFFNAGHKAFAAHFKAPLILFSTIGPNYWVNPLVGNPAPIAYVPESLTSYSSHMTFWERFMNSVCYVANELAHNFYLYPKAEREVKKFFPGEHNFYDILYNTSLVLLNSHPSLTQPVSLVPNMVEIGGYHITPPKKLPSDLQTFLDDAKEGVIYFSMGSNLRTADLPAETREAFLKTFSKLKQKVLWKWEDEILPGQPANVKLSKWFPQSDLLAHPNVKLFITHGGLLSSLETIYHGVPILAIPIFGDQKLNAQAAFNNGYGLFVPFRDVTEKSLTENIEQLLTNQKFHDNAKTRSKIFHDRITKPMDTAAYWVEYVVRHGGAPHLRVAGADLPWYQYLLLDVVAFVILSSVLILYLNCWIFKKICCRKNASQPPKKLKKN